MEKLKKISELLEKHDYKVCVSAESNYKNKIKASYPKNNLLSGNEKTRVCYDFFPDKSELLFTVNNESNKLYCRNYAFQTVIFTDIFNTCSYISYNTGMINFLYNKIPDASPEKFAKKCFLNPLEKNEQDMNQALKKCILDGTFRGFDKELDDYADEKGVTPEYTLIKECINYINNTHDK